jgi:methylmalonyl-CoA mutase N-terminal domain/subunit
VQELAFTLGDGIAYVEAALERGLDVDAFAGRLSFFFNAHIDFFEDKAKSERSMWLRFHTQTAGCSLSAQQPFNNVVRTAVEALAAVLGGTQSLHTNSFDEVLAIPTEEAATIALRTQQILAEETGVVNAIDPLGGSYFVESLTDEMEAAAYGYINKIDDMGGMLKAIERNYPQMEIADAAYRFQRDFDEQKKTMVGVNKYVTDEEIPVDIYHVDETLEERQIARTNAVKNSRDQRRVGECLERLGEACSGNENVMPYLIDAASAYVTLQEMCDVFRKVFGTYRDPGTF